MRPFWLILLDRPTAEPARDAGRRFAAADSISQFTVRASTVLEPVEGPTCGIVPMGPYGGRSLL
jgi:hypothetical protein